MNRRRLIKARKKIDQIDNKIFILIKKRTKIVNYMLSLKSFKNQIIDQKRIDQILKKIKNKSRIARIDPKITSKISKSIIWGYIDYQKRNYKKK